jgi:hypothetical protein
MGGGDQLGGHCEALYRVLFLSNFTIWGDKDYLHVQESFGCNLWDEKDWALDVTKEEADYLKSMLGVKNNHRHKWGYRNHYTTTAGSVDCLILQLMESNGLVVQGNMSGSVVFHATEKGARSIGFDDEQIKRTDFHENKRS